MNLPTTPSDIANPARRFGGAIATVVTTLRGLRGQSRRLLATACAVMLGVAFTAGTLVLTDTLRESFDAMHVDAHAGVDLVIRRQASFGAGHDAVRNRLDADLVAVAADAPGVVVAAGRTTGWAQLAGPDGTLLGDIASGVDPVGENWIRDDRLNPWRLVAGSPPSTADEVVIDRAAARLLAVSTGDAVDVLALGGRHEMSVAGIATFGDADDRFGTVTIMFAEATAQRLLGEPGRHDSVVVALEEAAVADVVAQDIGRTLGDAHEIVTGDVLVDEARALHLQDWGFFDTVMKGFAVIALVVGGFIIFNTFSITVAQRTREFAMLRAIGAGRAQVLGSVLTESVAVGAAASLLGLVGGVAVSAGLRSLFTMFGLDLPDDGMIVRDGSLLVAFALGVVITALSALLPAWRAARTAPIAALRESATEASLAGGSAGSRIRIATGMAGAMAGAGAMALGLAGVGDAVALVGLGGLAVFGGVAALGPVLARPFGRLVGDPIAAIRGVPGELARDNATRSPKRTAATAAALMIGVGLVGFITILAASIKASIDEMVSAGVRADIVVESGSFGFGGLDRSLVEELRTLPEVVSVSGSTLASAEVDGEVIELVGIDSEDYPQLIDLGATEGSLGGSDGTGLGLDRLAVGSDVASERGWSLGSAVSVTLADGQERTLTVGAIVEDPYIGLPPMVDISLLQAAGLRPFDVQVFIGVADGVDRDAALAAVATVAERLPNAAVLDRAAFAEDRAGLVDPLLGVVYALLAFAVLIATLGIANTLALSVMERTREIGLLRAIGATRAQVRTAVRWESVMIAGLGTTLGLSVGAGFGWAVVRALESEGISRLVIPAAPLGVVVAIALATGVVAAVIPARRAARLDVLAALRA